MLQGQNVPQLGQVIDAHFVAEIIQRRYIPDVSDVSDLYIVRRSICSVAAWEPCSLRDPRCVFWVGSELHVKLVLYVVGGAPSSSLSMATER